MTPCYAVLRIESGQKVRLLLDRQPLALQTPEMLFEDDGFPLGHLTEKVLGYLRHHRSLALAPPGIVIEPCVLHDPLTAGALVKEFRSVEHELGRRIDYKQAIRGAYRHMRQELLHVLDPAYHDPPRRRRRAPTLLRDVVWSHGPDGECTHIGEAWRQYTGHAPGEDLGEGWESRIHPQDRRRVGTIWHHAFAKRVSFTYQYRLRRANGAYIWVESHGDPQFTAAGVFLGYVGYLFEISEPESKIKIVENDPE